MSMSMLQTCPFRRSTAASPCGAPVSTNRLSVDTNRMLKLTSRPQFAHAKGSTFNGRRSRHHDQARKQLMRLLAVQ